MRFPTDSTTLLTTFSVVVFACVCCSAFSGLSPISAPILVSFFLVFVLLWVSIVRALLSLRFSQCFRKGLGSVSGKQTCVFEQTVQLESLLPESSLPGLSISERRWPVLGIFKSMNVHFVMVFGKGLLFVLGNQNEAKRIPK